MNQPIKIFIGFDSREPIAFSVLAHSIIRRASCPVSITPVSLSSLHSVYTRSRGPKESTEFSLTRFLVPALSGFTGWSLFLDCDMLCLIDIAELWAYTETNGEKAVLCCQHDYTPSADTKFFGQTQTTYPKKNWSSAMLLHNPQCRALTPDYVNTATGLDLHRFHWTTDKHVGALPLEFNYLVGEANQASAAPKMIHYTNGGPWLREYRSCEHADLWFAEKMSMLDGSGGILPTHEPETLAVTG